MTTELPDFEGVPVIQSSVKITRAGDGLSDSLKVAPIARHVGEKGWYMIETECTQVNHKPIKTGIDELERVHTEAVTAIAMVSEADVKAFLDAAADRVRLAQEAEEGIQRIPGMGGDDAEFEMAAAHSRGEHADGLVDACPVCQSEIAAFEGEQPTNDGGDGSVTEIGKPRGRTRKS